MSSRAPLISVIIPAYNGERYLAEALESVRKQGYAPIETIIVDDGSTDATAEIVGSADWAKYVFQENAGSAAAMNTGLKHAAGSLLAFLDQDDIWTDHKLVSQRVVLDRDPAVDLVQAWLTQFVSPELDMRTRGLFPGDGKVAAGPIPGTTLIRREAFSKVGFFDTELTVGYFADWMFRAQEAGLKMVMLEDVLLRRRLHPSNQGVTGLSSRVEYARAAKAALDRRRRT